MYEKSGNESNAGTDYYQTRIRCLSGLGIRYLLSESCLYSIHR